MQATVRQDDQAVHAELAGRPAVSLARRAARDLEQMPLPGSSPDKRCTGCSPHSRAPTSSRAMAAAATSVSRSPTTAPNAFSARPRPSPPSKRRCSPRSTPNNNDASTPTSPLVPTHSAGKAHRHPVRRRARDRTLRVLPPPARRYSATYLSDRPATQCTRQPRPGGKPTCTSVPSPRTMVGTTPLLRV